MSKLDSPWELPDQALARAEEADREIRISDFILMALLPLRSVGIAGIVPLNEVAMAVLIVLCLFRPARSGSKLSSVLALALVALLGLLLYSGIVNDVEWNRRVGHIAIMIGIIWAGGTGRVSLRSVGAGLAAGLIAVIGLALAGVGGNPYPGRLTGFLADPNAGAYFIVTLGVLAIFFCDPRWTVRLAIAVPIIIGLVLCYSRTGLLASAFALAWLLVARRLGVIGGPAMAAGLVWLVDNIPDDLITIGAFSDRSGSDKLRERIIAQEHVQLADIPWYGGGPGTATVQIRDLEFYFHNSYLATRQEGGWIALLLILGIMTYAFLRLSKQTRAGDLQAAAAQAAIVGAAVMAITLGEVLLDTPVSVAVAMALGHALRPGPETVEALDG